MRQFGGLARLLLETLGLALALGVLIVVGAYHYFDGFIGQSAFTALGFSLAALVLSLVPIQAYVAFRFLQLKRQNTSLLDAASRDGLTRLLNRATFKSGFEMQTGRIGRRRGDSETFTFLVVDADHFKKINDTLGHVVGDQALRAIANTLRTSLRADDLVGRLGGEEFGVLLYDAGFAEAKIVAERLRLAVNALVVGPKNAPRRLSVSIGGVTFASALPFEAVFRVADANLYRAKRGGRNQFNISNAVRPIRIEGDNRGATKALAYGTDPIVVDGRALRRSG